MQERLLFHEAEVTSSLSSNLLKGCYISGGNAAADTFVIDSNERALKRLEAILPTLRPVKEGTSAGGFVEGLAAERLTVAESEEQASGIIKAKGAEEIVNEARQEAEQILQNANAQADAVRADAQSQAQQVLTQATEAGREQGYQEGFEQAQRELEKAREELAEKEKELEAMYQKQLDSMEPELVDAITGIYEHIFHVELHSYREILTHLISETMHKIDSSRDYIIHVSKEDYPYVSMHKKQLASGALSGGSSLEVIEDITLSRNQCMIETEGGIFDCGLGTQLDELRQRLLLLSYDAGGKKS